MFTFRQFSILTSVVVAVTTATSVSNLMSVRSGSNIISHEDAQNLNQYQYNGSCDEEKMIHRQRMRSMFDVCLRECIDFNIEVDDDDVGFGYQDTAVNATARTIDGDKAQESQRALPWSKTKMALLSLLWYLLFTNSEVQQLFLLVSFLIVTGHHKDTGAIFSFFIAWLPYYLVGRNKDEVFYYHEESEDAVSFRLGLGGRTFTGVVSGPKHYL